MATTIVACALRFDSAVVSNAGDSRCYLFRNGNVSQLTRDHTMVDEQVRLGILTKAQAATGANRHLLTRSLGNELFVAADTITVNIMPDDVLLLCSDGLHGYVSDAAIQRIVNSTTRRSTRPPPRWSRPPTPPAATTTSASSSSASAPSNAWACTGDGPYRLL